MFGRKNENIENKKTLIFIFLEKITPKNMQDLTFFLQENNFGIKRMTKKNKKNKTANLPSIFVNANFFLESPQNIRREQLKNILNFLKKHTQIHGILFQNQVLNLERSLNLENPSLFSL